MRKTVVWLALTFSCQHSWQRLIYFQCTFSFITPSTFGERKKKKKNPGILTAGRKELQFAQHHLSWNDVNLLQTAGIRAEATCMQSLAIHESENLRLNLSILQCVKDCPPPPPPKKKKKTSDFCSKWTASRISHQVSLSSPPTSPQNASNGITGKVNLFGRIHYTTKRRKKVRVGAGGGGGGGGRLYSYWLIHTKLFGVVTCILNDWCIPNCLGL